MDLLLDPRKSAPIRGSLFLLLFHQFFVDLRQLDRVFR
jgi:hypothetical protein